MSIMMISEVAGQTAHGYDQLFAHVSNALRTAPGFLMHSSYPTEGGWRVIELWESREDAGRFFAEHIAPNLPEHIRPKLTFEQLHDVVVPDLRSA
jgi:heme-degrading monooxygenase HmoA